MDHYLENSQLIGGVVVYIHLIAGFEWKKKMKKTGKNQ